MKNHEKIYWITVLSISLIFVIYMVSDHTSMIPNGNKNFFKGKTSQNLTEKEIYFLDSINSLDSSLQIGIKKPVSGLYAYGSNIYRVDLNILYSMKYIDKSTNVQLKDFSKVLYNYIIEDSDIYDMREIKFNINIKKNDITKRRNFTVLKDSLEKWCGFKVVKINDSIFTRKGYFER